MQTVAGTIDELVAALEPELIILRRHLHAHPELSWQEHRTQAHVASWLRDRGIETRTTAGTGLVVDLPGSGEPVLYRGDMDALPVRDTKDPAAVPYASTTPALCHACGHDVHTTVAAGVAAVLHGLGAARERAARIVFQPAEEVIPSGAERVAEDGELQGVAAGLALHVDPSMDVGHVGMRAGPITSATDTFAVTVRGKSGHSARPHLSHDAVLAASEVVRALYTVVGQAVDPLEPAVLVVGRIEGGTATNVIAAQVALEGTVRTLSVSMRETLHDAMRAAATHAAALWGCTAETRFTLGAPPVRNDEALLANVRSAAVEVLGEAGVLALPRASMGAEDFGVFSDWMPTAMIRLGCRTPGTPARHLHEEGFDLDERCIAIAVRTMVRALLRAGR